MDERSTIRLALTNNGESRAGANASQDPLLHPELFDGVIWRRSCAFLLDLAALCCLFALVLLATCVVAIVSLGLVSIGAILALPVLGVLYDTICVGGSRSATPGMRAMGLNVQTWDGPKPDHWQSFLSSVLFWTTVPATSCLILLFPFFDARSRCLHDVLAGTIVLRAT